MHKRKEHRSGRSKRLKAMALLCALPLAVNCGGGGGGGGGGAISTASFTTPATTTAEAGSALVLQVELNLPANLEEDAVFLVQDNGTGTATSGSDYVTFTPTTLTFTTGEGDGAMRTLNWTPIDDGDSEGDESVQLQMTQVSGPVFVGGSGVINLTIYDDEAASLLVANASNADAPVIPGGVIDLGSRDLGSGLDSSAEITITNNGVEPLLVKVPVIDAGDAADFAVLNNTNLFPATAPPSAGNGFGSGGTVGSGNQGAGPSGSKSITATGTQAEPATELPFPLFGLGAAATATAPGDNAKITHSQVLSAIPALVDALSILERVTLTDVPVPGQAPVTLELERIELPIAAGAVLAVDGVAQPQDLADQLTELSLWHGRALGYPESKAYLAFSTKGSNGWVQLQPGVSRTLHLVSSPHSVASAASTSQLYWGDSGVPGGATNQPICSGSRNAPAGVPSLQNGLQPTAMGPGENGLFPLAMVSDSSVYSARLAVETDYQFYQRFGDATALTTYVTQLVAAVGERFAADVGAEFDLVYIGVHTTPSDPWSVPDGGGDANDLLDEFQSAWAPSFGGTLPVAFDLAHFLSGSSLGGGVAYVGTLCNPDYAYGVSTGVYGNIDFSTFDGSSSPLNWDFFVMAHEMGHNFGAQHTHEYCPPLDTCGYNCEGAACERGTLMSYCHTCHLGLDNIDLRFHPRISNVMRRSANRSCMTQALLAPGDSRDFTVRFDPVTQLGELRATLYIEHDAATMPSPFPIQLLGVAVSGAPPAAGQGQLHGYDPTK